MRTSPRAMLQLRRRGRCSVGRRPGTKERPAPGESSSSVARCRRARVAPNGPEHGDVPRSPTSGGRLGPVPPALMRPCCDEVAAGGGLPLGTQGMVRLTLDVLHAHEAGLEGQLGEAKALLVLAEVLDAE